MKKLISWNVNGIRAAEKKGLLEWLQKESPDVLCLQETKASPEQLSGDLREPPGYTVYWSSAERKGYSGTALYTRNPPLETGTLGWTDGDKEGRTLVAHWDDFSLINCYFPNSQAEGKRLGYKLDFCAAVKELCDNLKAQGRRVVLCGDYNIAHEPLDLANPQSNEKNPGYLPEERAWMSSFLNVGYADTFREAHPGEGDHYSWWSYRFKAREKNIGWRIDYFCVNREALKTTENPRILSTVTGSDHCPVEITLK